MANERADARVEDVIETLYALHYEPLVRFAWLLTGGAGAEDLVQDAFVKAIRRWDRDAAPEAFRAWAHTTMLRLHLSKVRRAARELAAVSRLRERPAPEPQPVPEVMLALATLTPRQRAAVLLRYFEDLPEAEVAVRMSCRPGTVKALLHQARARLKVEPSLRAETG